MPLRDKIGGDTGARGLAGVLGLHAQPCDKNKLDLRRLFISPL